MGRFGQFRSLDHLRTIDDDNGDAEITNAKLVVCIVRFKDTKPYLDLMGGNLRLIREAIPQQGVQGASQVPGGQVPVQGPQVQVD